MLAGAAGLGLGSAQAQQPTTPPARPAPMGNTETGGLRKGMFSYMLAHEQFQVPELVRVGARASHAGFDMLCSSDHLQPWQANEGHAGEAWVTMAATGAQSRSWMGTTVTCPTLRYNPAVVAEAFASLSLLYPGRIFLGVGSGEALNEQAATGVWPKWQERWDRLIEAIAIIRELWSGKEVAFKGKYYTVNARLYDPPAKPIPLLTAANGQKSMRLAGVHGDGLVTDPESWRKWKPHWEDGARSAGKNPADMPVLLEQYVVVGDEAAAQKPAELWRFGPKAWKGLYDVMSPVEIQQKAEAGTPMPEVLKSWLVSNDPQAHIKKMRELFDSGATIINVHAPQADQEKVLDFYAREVLPRFRRHA
ncbi:MAG TPA: TIGR03557 family F420-dependent LLM class oxidoreductase [Rhodopila sp.]|nr:TIGR03557 family F420-dependent LLM class oxidoreductase [Rhodopila sp.]